MQAYTDKQIEWRLAIIKWTLEMMLSIHFHITPCNLPVSVVVDRSRR